MFCTFPFLGQLYERQIIIPFTTKSESCSHVTTCHHLSKLLDDYLGSASVPAAPKRKCEGGPGESGRVSRPELMSESEMTRLVSRKERMGESGL